MRLSKLNEQDVKLSNFRRSDKLIINEWHNNLDDRVILMGYRFPVSDETSEEWINDRLRATNRFPEEIYWAIRQISTDRLIGYVTLFNIDYISKNSEIGIYISNFRGSGIGTEVIFECLDRGFQDLVLEKIYARVIISNVGGIKLFQKCGFAREGVLKRHYWNGKKWEDIVIMSKFRDEY